jgi:flagellar hook-basal body complex protein FliE
MTTPVDPRVTVGAMLARMEALEAASKPAQPSAMREASQPIASVDFATLLRDAVREVSAAQNAAQAKAQSFQLGDRTVSIEDVMISLQQASLAMQGMVAVRNKLVEAYRDISNMPV